MSCIGGGNLTPNIDRLARDSVVFTRAFANGPATNQSFPAILTSTYFLIHPGMRLPHSYTTLAEVLRNHGFKTVAFHSNPFLSKSLGWGRGFEEFYDFMDVIKNPSAAVTRSDFSAKLAEFINRITGVVDNNHVNSLLRRIYFRWNKFEMPYIEGKVLNNYVTKWILRNKEEKFFLWMHYMDPHRPYVPPPFYLENFSTRKEAFIFDVLVNSRISQRKITESELETLKVLYKGEVKYVDYCIGRLLQFLDTHGLIEKSLVILSADHGEAFKEHGVLTHPFDIVYNEVIHVPLIIYGLTDNPTVLTEYVQLLDVAPTIINVTGIRKPRSFLGDSLTSVLEGEQQRKPIFSESARPDLFNLAYNVDKKVVSCIMGEWKLIINEFWETTELYNIEKDPYEKNDLAATELKIREQLTAMIRKHLIFEEMKSKEVEKEKIRARLRVLRV